jgi:hypothetical protein
MGAAGLVPPGSPGHAPRPIGYGLAMERENSRLLTVGLVVGGLAVLLVVLWFVRQYAAG